VSTWPAAVIETNVVPTGDQLVVAFPGSGGEDGEGSSERGEDTSWATNIDTLEGEDDWLVHVNLEVEHLSLWPTTSSWCVDDLSIVVELVCVVNIGLCRDGLEGWGTLGGGAWGSLGASSWVAANHGGESGVRVLSADGTLVCATWLTGTLLVAPINKSAVHVVVDLVVIGPDPLCVFVLEWHSSPEWSLDTREGTISSIRGSMRPVGVIKSNLVPSLLVTCGALP